MASASCSMTSAILRRSFPSHSASDCAQERLPPSRPPAFLQLGPKLMTVPAPSSIQGGKGSFLGRGDKINRLPKTIRSTQHAAGVSKRPTGVRAAANPVTEFLSRFTGKSYEKREDLKEELLEKIRGLERGAAATEEEKAEVDKLASRLETINPNPKSLSSPLISGKWKLLYTTSESILGTKRPKLLRPNGDIFQYIDAEQLAAKNTETWPFFNQVTAKLTPESSSKVKVQFQYFKIFGLISVKAPETAQGYLDTTYVDEDLRISRGDKGNLFILQQADSSARLG